MPTRFNRIYTHYRPHLDELLAIRLLKNFGQQEFPGVRQAEVLYVRDGESPEGKSWEQHMSEGSILIGVGGGPFDEHPTSQGEERKGHESACSLVAKRLKVGSHPVYKHLIQLVTEADQTGVHPMHIANRLKTRNRVHPNDHQAAIDFALDILDDWEAEQRLFLEAQRELHQLCGTDAHCQITGPNESLDLVVVQHSDNFKMGSAARTLKIAVLIQVQPTGHVQVFSDTINHNFTMKYVAAAWRKAELLENKWSKAKVADLDPDYLMRAGKVAEVTNIFYQVPGENILNGSETTPDTLPTKVPVAKIVKIVRDFAFAEPATQMA